MNEGTNMTRRICRMAAKLLCIGLLTLPLAGCFGGGGEPSDTTSDINAPTSSTTGVSIPVSTTEASSLIEGLPRAFVESLGTRPIVVLFYAPGGVEDEKVLTAVRELQSAYSSYTFLSFDYRVPAAYGDLSKELAIHSLPQLVLLDRHGVTQTIWSGYVDKVTFAQTLVTLGRY